MQTVELKKPPEAIATQMRLWRLGLVGLPQGYIEWHKQLATEAKQQLLDAGYIIHREMMVNDGWGDGMQFLCLIVEHEKSCKLFKIKWADGQRWYSACAHHCGWVLFEPEKDWRR